MYSASPWHQNISVSDIISPCGVCIVRRDAHALPGIDADFWQHIGVLLLRPMQVCIGKAHLKCTQSIVCTCSHAPGYIHAAMPSCVGLTMPTQHIPDLRLPPFSLYSLFRRDGGQVLQTRHGSHTDNLQRTGQHLDHPVILPVHTYSCTRHQSAHLRLLCCTSSNTLHHQTPGLALSAYNNQTMASVSMFLKPMEAEPTTSPDTIHVGKYTCVPRIFSSQEEHAGKHGH